MTFLQALAYGVLQGMTQFLPVSASGHLVLLPWFFRWPDPALPLRVFLVTGTFTSLLVCFGKEWWYLIRGGVMSIIERKIGFDRDRNLFWLMLVTVSPSLLAGVLFRDVVRDDFQAPLVIAVFLASVGFFLYWIDGRYATLRAMEEIKVKDSLFIGCALASGLVPGVSRVAAAVIMARLLGLGRESAVRFSLLALGPVALGHALYLWWELTLQPGIAIPMPELMTGFAVASLVGVITIHALLGFARQSTLALFAWYRVALATMVVLWSLVFKI